jgi:predicted MFS family arabinose efflux permease
MGISFLGQGLSMITGGAIAYFLNWRGVFAVYALLSLIPMTLIIKNYKSLPDTKHADSKMVAPYLKLLGNANSLFTYLLVLLEGMFIIGSFSYLGAFISKTYHFNYLMIGLIMTAFGVMTVVGGRLSGKLSQKRDSIIDHPDVEFCIGNRASRHHCRAGCKTCMTYLSKTGNQRRLGKPGGNHPQH